MEYELKVLEHIITVVLNPTRIETRHLNEDFLSECKLHAENEQERIKKQFRLMAFSGAQEGDLASYYRNHQVILVQLSDIVYNYLQPAGTESIYRLTKEDSILGFYKLIAEIPEGLLTFIEKSLPEFFDREVKLPDARRWPVVSEYKNKTKGLQKALARLVLEVDIIKIAISPFEYLLLTEKAISYHDLAYARVLEHELNVFAKNPKVIDANQELCRLLLQMNFNGIDFFNYYVLQIQETVKGNSTVQDLIEYYSLKFKIINQLPVRPGLIYKSELPSIREQVGSWISEELYYLDKQERILFLEPGQKTGDQSSEKKIHTSLSVAHLAMAVKLLVEAKVITNTNSKDLIRMVARNFRTDRQEVISEESLWNKSYSFESATVNRLKDEIIGLMNLARKY